MSENKNCEMRPKLSRSNFSSCFEMKKLLCTHKDSVSEWQFFVLSILGPICLLLSISCILLKFAQHLWPIIFTTSCGFFCIWKWKKTALVVSLLVLAGAYLAIVHSQDILWTSILCSSIALGWLLTFLGQQDAYAWISMKEKMLRDLKEDNAAILHDLEKLEAIASQDQSEMALLLERFKKETDEIKERLFSLNSKLEQEEKDKVMWKSKADQLSLEISSYQRKENAFQHALEDAQSQLFLLKNANAQLLIDQQTTLSKEQASIDPTQEKSLQMLQVKYGQLKEQFYEKSEALHHMRKELFLLESAFLTLQKQTEENACSFSEDDAFHMHSIMELQNQCHSLESEVEMLQDLVTHLVQPKKSLHSKKRKNSKEAQEDLFLMMQDKVSEA